MRVYITDFGAVGDAKTINTQAIQNAIDFCSQKGGGVVIVPKGVFLSAPIRLKSNITLYIEDEGCLKATPNIEDYKPIGYYHNEWGEVTSFLYCMNEKNITIKGRGFIDLSGKAFFDFSQVFNQFEGLSELTKDELEEVECKPLNRPNQPIFFYNCQNISIQDIRIVDSPCWTVCIHSSENVKINGIMVNNNLRIPNNDSIHICSSKNIIISDCFLVSGDDCIAITGITNWDKPCENIVISNCVLSTRSKAIAIGHLDSKVRNVTISNIIIQDTNRAIHIFANAKNGWIRSVNISNIIANTRIFAGTWWGKGEPIVIAASEEGNYIEDIIITNFISYAQNGIVIIGKGKNIKNIILKDIDIRLSYNLKYHKLFSRFIDITPSECPKAPENLFWLYAKDVENLKAENITYGYDKQKSSNKDFEIKEEVEDVLNFVKKDVIRV